MYTYFPYVLVNNFVDFIMTTPSRPPTCYCTVVGALTLEIALGAQVTDGQPQYAQSIQLAEDVLFEGQQRGEQVQFGIETFPMSLRWVAFRDAVLGRWFQTARQEGRTKTKTSTSISKRFTLVTLVLVFVRHIQQYKSARRKRRHIVVDVVVVVLVEIGKMHAIRDGKTKELRVQRKFQHGPTRASIGTC